MSAFGRVVVIVSLAGGLVYWLEKVVAYWLRRRVRGRAAAGRGPIAQVGEVGMCSRCGRPRLPPGVKAPDYLTPCACPLPSPIAAAEASRPPRPPIT